MTTSFELIKTVDQKTKDIVNGFITDLQSLLPNDQSIYYNIPSLVFIIITLYYYNPEYFTIHGDYMKLNDAKNIVEKRSAGRSIRLYGDSFANSVYGNILINKSSTGKHIWTFNIIKPNVGGIMVIGIDSSNKKFPNDDSIGSEANNKTAYYGYQSKPVWIDWDDDVIKSIRVFNSNVDENKYPKYYGDIYSHDSNEVKMELNMNTKTLKYYVNGKDQGIAFKNICFKNDEQYSMCITLYWEMTVKLSDYQHI